MKNLDFSPIKSTDDFRKNYKLHDIAEFQGKNLLTQWGFKCTEFGEDNRYKKVWEKGEDKPDAIISYKDKSALLDWKGKHGATWLINERAFKSYQKWSKEFNLPVVIAFFVIGKTDEIVSRNFAILNLHTHTLSTHKQWDQNSTIQFQKDIPLFTKANLLSILFDMK
ncbi:MAG: hypothetical protein KKF62_00795 [Bacteroidetes bacterium]|nr:hypothetical protein [Bacteroidota bacterium]MBU1114271.1 hypothetical protein [Bacteroidota bacterium]MBU1797665.1 hypothetical protein [Bacteroidota bacterium]